jgi:nucleoside-diphosphate-sugar epimerase
LIFRCHILNIIRKCDELNIFFIHLGSSAEYGSFDLVEEGDSFFEPQSVYGKTKFNETLAIYSMLESQSFLNLRLYNLVSSSQPTHTALGEILSKIKFSNSNSFTLNDFDIIRDYVTVDDLCRFIEFAIFSKISGIYNFGSGTGINLLEIVEHICKDFNIECLLGELNSGRIKSVVANNRKLLETGFKITPLSPNLISRIIL